MINTRNKRTRSLGKMVEFFNQKEQPPSENKLDFESMLSRFAVIFEKRHDVVDATIRNQQDAIKNTKTQLGPLTKIVNEWLPPKTPDQNPQSHVMAIFNEKEADSESLLIHDTAVE